MLPGVLLLVAWHAHHDSRVQTLDSSRCRTGINHMYAAAASDLQIQSANTCMHDTIVRCYASTSNMLEFRQRGYLWIPDGHPRKAPATSKTGLPQPRPSFINDEHKQRTQRDGKYN